MPNIVIQCKCMHNTVRPNASPSTASDKRQLSKKAKTIWTQLKLSHKATLDTESQNHFYRSNGDNDFVALSFRFAFFFLFCFSFLVLTAKVLILTDFIIFNLFHICRHRNASSIASISVFIARQWTWRHRSDQRRRQLCIECHLPAKFTATARTSVQTNPC